MELVNSRGYYQRMKETMIELHELTGRMIKVITTHKWFGREKYNCQLDLICDDTKIGFKIQNKEIYILKAELESFEKANGVYYIRDSLMEIAIIPK